MIVKYFLYFCFNFFVMRYKCLGDISVRYKSLNLRLHKERLSLDGWETRQS